MPKKRLRNGQSQLPLLYCRSERQHRQTQSTEKYLEAIFRLERKNGAVRVKDIATELGLQKGSVSGALKKLDERGLIVYPPYQPINLTDEGRRIAEYIVWRHGILTRFLAEVLQMAPDEAESAGRRLGYAVEEKVIVRMLNFMAGSYAHAFSSSGTCESQDIA